MKGSKWILVLAAVLAIASASARANEYAMPLDRTISPGPTHVKYDGIIYNIYSSIECSIRFEEIDSRHVKITIKPAKTELVPYCELSIQWYSFPAALLTLGASGENSWLLGTETGYAEK